MQSLSFKDFSNSNGTQLFFTGMITNEFSG